MGLRRALLFTIVSLLTIKSNVEGICKDSVGTTVTDVFSKYVTKGTNFGISGNVRDGYSIKCEVNSANSYSLYLWQLKINNGSTLETVFTYFIGTTAIGPGYTGRGLTFENNNTVKFPDMIVSDRTHEDFECTIRLNSATVTCRETQKLNVFVEPIVSVTPNCEPILVGKDVTLTVSGSDFLPANATFIMMINNENHTLSKSVTAQGDGFYKLTSEVTFTVTDVKILEVEMFMTVDNSVVNFNSTSFEVVPDPNVGLLVLLVVCIVLTLALVIPAVKLPENKKLKIAACSVAVIGCLMSFIIFLLMLIRYCCSTYFVPNVVLSVLEIIVASAFGLFLKFHKKCEETKNTTGTKKAEEKKVEEKNVEAKKVEGKNVEAKKVEGKNVEEKKVEGKNVEEKKVEGKNVEAKKVEGKNVEEKKVEEKNVEAKKVEGKNVEVKKVEEKKTEKKKVEEKKTEKKKTEEE